MTDAASSTPLMDLIQNKKVVVCCGAGGVGKTSCSAALALAGARAGRRVLVLTIDPSKRLAETLGVSQNPTEPVALDEDLLRGIGIEKPAALDAWMLDPKIVSDHVVHKLSNSKADAEKLMENRIYKNVTAMVAGMQEYTAVEAMYEFINDGRYDLVILDTPPSRNALHFLEAPGRIQAFLDGRVFRFFLPDGSGGGGLIKKAASKVLDAVMDLAFGKETRRDLMGFFGLFSGILMHLSRDAGEMRSFFASSEVAFLVVTSPAQEALEEAEYFERKTRDELSLNLCGYILNRSIAEVGERKIPSEELLSSLSADGAKALNELAQREKQQTLVHQELLATLQARMSDGAIAVAAPYLSQGVNDLDSLVKLVEDFEKH